MATLWRRVNASADLNGNAEHAFLINLSQMGQYNQSCIRQPLEFYFERAGIYIVIFFLGKKMKIKVKYVFLRSCAVDGFNSGYKKSEDRPHEPT